MIVTPSETIRRAIQADGRSLRDIADAAGLDIAQLSRFMRNERGLTTHSLDALCQSLAVRVVLVKLKKPKAEKESE